MTAARAKRRQEEGEQERTCALTRCAQDPSGLIRFVSAPDGTIVPDLRRKLPGRGVWITARFDSVAEAVRKNVFARSLKLAVKPDADLAARVDALLLDEVRQSLAMANKAGLVTTGAFQVEKQIARGNVVALVHASDGAPDGRRKMQQVLKRSLGDQAGLVAIVDFFDSNQLDLALGHTNVIHAALRRGAASDAFLARCRRLDLYRGQLAGQKPLQSAMEMDYPGANSDPKAEVK